VLTQLLAGISLWVLRFRSAVIHRCLEVRRIEIILAGDPDQSKKRVPSRVSQCGPHAPRSGRICDGANRPVGGDPLPGLMGQDRGEIDQPGRLVDGGRLHGRNFMLAEDFANDLKPAREWRIAKCLFSPARTFLADGRDQRLFWID
jgi:hypothetical protein